MSDPVDNPRAENKLKERVQELERTVIALVKALKATEEETGEPLMPEGSYFGIDFKD